MEDNRRPEQVYLELENAVQQLSTRGLFAAAKWASEQLVGLEPGVLETSTSGAEVRFQLDPVEMHPKFMLARSHFNFKVPNHA